MAKSILLQGEGMTLDVKLKPVSINFTLKDHIYEVLRETILDVDIYDVEEDMRLDERQLAEQLGISRTPIREALARLAQDGLVEIVPRKGVYIHRKSLPEILDMIVTWAALESMAAHIATREASDAEGRCQATLESDPEVVVTLHGKGEACAAGERRVLVKHVAGDNVYRAVPAADYMDAHERLRKLHLLPRHNI